MKNYTDYGFYKNTYKGNMPKDDFDRLVIRASAEVRSIIFNRDIKGFEPDVQFVTCYITDTLYKIEQIEEKKTKLISSAKEDRILASEGVGDLNKTFANTNKMADLNAEISNLLNKKNEEVRSYLLHTGLLYRGI